MMAGASYSALALVHRLMRQARPYWLQIGTVFVLDLLATPLVLLKPLALKIAVDSVVGKEPLPGFLRVLLPDSLTSSRLRLLIMAAALQVLVVLLFQLHGLATYLLRTRAGEGVVLDFRATLFRHLQRLSLTFHDTRGTADSIYRVQDDAPAIRWITIDGFLPLASDTAMLVGMLYVTLRIDWHLALVALGVAPFLVLSIYAYNQRTEGRYTEMKELESGALQVVQEVLSSVRIVKAFGREEGEQQRFLHCSRRGVQARVRLALSESTLGIVVNLTTTVGMALVLFLGIRNVLSGVLTLGSLLMVLTYLEALYGPLQSITNQVAGLQSSLASARRAFEVLDEVTEVEERPNARPLKRTEGALEFVDASFSYDGEHTVLRNVSFAVPAGTRVGVAGRTGAGKTTLASLLMRFYDPTAGRILLDGVDLRDYKLADLRNQFALVLQESVLFSTTIAENIAYGRPGATEQEIVEAAKAANAHDFIVGLPKGYQTEVGERGMMVSGGERQRIALARAFLKDAPVLILDEPTSAVDVKTEAAILEAMQRLMHGRTSFLISHRVSTLANCDVLLRIEHGQASQTTKPAWVLANEVLQVR